MNRVVLAFVLILSSALMAFGDNDNVAVVDYETNFNTPAVSQKAAVAVRKHIGDIGNALKRKNFNADMVRKGEVVRLTIPCSDFFGPNDTVLSEAAKKRLIELKPIIEQPKMYKVIAAVYTDDTGDEIYADEITWTRASAIYEYLCSTTDVKEPNVVPYGMGHSDAKGANNSIKNRALNRRIEILVVPEWNLIKDAASGKLAQ